jgi:tetratricopeptide (TPR) repeat protein
MNLAVTSLQWVAIGVGTIALVGVMLWRMRRNTDLRSGSFYQPKGDRIPIRVDAKAKALAAHGDYEGALAVYRDFLRSHPDSALALNNAGALCLNLRKAQEARQLLEKAVCLDPSYASGWVNLADAAQMQRDLTGARRCYKTALKCDPNSVDARIGLARVLLEEKRHQEAVQLLEEAVRLGPKRAVAWMNLGFARMMSGNLVGAENAFRTALKYNRKLAAAREGLERNQAEAALVTRAERIGAVVTGEDGTVRSTANTDVLCAGCGRRYTTSGNVSRQTKAQGGLRCGNCGSFYCEPCVANVVFDEASHGRFRCDCGRSTADLGGGGEWSYRGFDELVVFRSS